VNPKHLKFCKFDIKFGVILGIIRNNASVRGIIYACDIMNSIDLKTREFSYSWTDTGPGETESASRFLNRHGTPDS
jgi:hypothetical protein